MLLVVLHLISVYIVYFKGMHALGLKCLLELRTFALIVSAHPSVDANSHATSCMSALAK